ncbi:hypothetical protein NDU88_000908 [Pleurodeles waltl]|uniref:Uncharacterized protein n=1 Tax=Pleurodeles waltl TaxID=8319 RepID=A0AAV7MI79_PLEWA|nr:hypothetical protein NDU88_000908 [Pleurodeles waltl]
MLPPLRTIELGFCKNRQSIPGTVHSMDILISAVQPGAQPTHGECPNTPCEEPSVSGMGTVSSCTRTLFLLTTKGPRTRTPLRRYEAYRAPVVQRCKAQIREEGDLLSWACDERAPEN